MLPYVMQFNLPSRIPAFAEVAGALGLPTADMPAEEAASAAVERVAEIAAAIGIPSSLRDLGIAESDLDGIASDAMEVSRLIENNPRALDRVSMRAVLDAAWHGDRERLTAAPAPY
jgi:alcohol dehydrogenase